MCHGDQGRASPSGYVPRLAGKPADYLLAQMQAFRDGQRPHDGKARLLHNADDATLQALAAHFAARQLPYPAPGRPPPAAAAAARAQQIVRQGLPQAGVPACASCHGQHLMGRGTLVPGLLGLPRDYLLGQLGAWREGIRRGRAPDCMAVVAQRLPVAELPGLADWLAAQPVPVGAAAQPEPAPMAPPAATGLDCAGPPAQQHGGPPALPAAAATDARIARGAELAVLGNCAGCHSQRGAAAFSGGEPLATPFGTVHAGNLTPDAATGLGGWTADDFWQALHHGRGRDGRRLVPAFPYTSYTQLPREDSDALFAYFQSLPAVQRARPAQALRFPYGTQPALALWQWLWFRPADTAKATGTPPAADPVLARGRLLVTGLGHCLECHAPRNRWGARSDDPSGALMPEQDWWAPSLHPLPGQQAADIVALLRDGRHGQAAAVGPMARVVQQSTRHWRDADLQAAARYLLSLPPQPAAAPAPAAAAETLALGRQLYARHCADCHGRQGEGLRRAGALRITPLAGNPAIGQPHPGTLVQMLRHGGFGAGSGGQAPAYGMPPLALSAAEQAAVLTWLRQTWGPRASAVGPRDLGPAAR